ncbi:hypothetical protein SDC9_170235 [bioreactor metagenome]|uniref:Uncharacterized protein n=1 Tax=bioreactor metagenome TaxID=1076179 RepID=A0A645G9Z5_9ZZZZ
MQVEPHPAVPYLLGPVVEVVLQPHTAVNIQRSQECRTELVGIRRVIVE